MNAIAMPLTVSDIVEEYAEKDAAIDQAIADFKAAETRLDASATVLGCYVERNISPAYLNAATLRKNLLKSGWQSVYNRLQIDALASANDKKLFAQAMADPAPLTVENAKATFGDYLIRPRFHILRGVAEVFCSLDPAYKSHSNVRIGVKGLPKRVILNGWGGFHGSYARDRFQDMLRALAALRGHAAPEWAEMLDIDEQHKSGQDAVMNGRTISRYVVGGKDEEFVAPDRGVTVRKFGNGNAHIYFDKWALLDINRALGEFYGEVLPDVADPDAKHAPGTDVAKDLQFYWSPRPVIDAALEFAGVPDPKHYRGDAPVQRILEPSCGDGRILDAIRERGHRGYGVEFDAGRATQAKAKGHTVLTANFLECAPEPGFDTVLMNPPFYGKHYAKHVRHALKFLKPGGVLVAILPASARYDHDEFADLLAARSKWSDSAWQDLPVASFADAGTNVPTTMLKLRVPAA